MRDWGLFEEIFCLQFLVPKFTQFSKFIALKVKISIVIASPESTLAQLKYLQLKRLTTLYRGDSFLGRAYQFLVLKLHTEKFKGLTPGWKEGGLLLLECIALSFLFASVGNSSCSDSCVTIKSDICFFLISSTGRNLDRQITKVVCQIIIIPWLYEKLFRQNKEWCQSVIKLVSLGHSGHFSGKIF